MLKALLVAATLSQHWVCATPVDPSTNPAYIFLQDFTVDGNELVQHRATRFQDVTELVPDSPGSQGAPYR
jgi:hypothetical protein